MTLFPADVQKDATDPVWQDPKWGTLFASASVEWTTPDEAYRWADERFGPFEIDVCATPDNARCDRFWTVEQNALIVTWPAAACWMNPPYDQCDAFIRKAAAAVARGSMVVALVPARTDTKWFHEVVLAGRYEVWFAKGRLKFGGASTGAPFPSMMIVMRPPVGLGGAA